MAALQGLTGLYPDPQATGQYMDEGVLEAKANAIDSDHSQYGAQYLGYSGTVPSESPFASMGTYEAGFTDEYGGMVTPYPGVEIDSTPTTHRAPYPRGIIQFSNDEPSALAAVGEQMTELHSLDFGGPRHMTGVGPAGHEEETHYTTDRYDAPNENALATLTEGQLKAAGSAGRGGAGGGNADPTQGYGVLNTLPEFQMGHSIRRVQHDSVHFDYTNTHGEQDVPFPARHPVQQMPLDGPDSPYFEMGDIDGANVPWEGRIGDPGPYEQPAEPTMANTPVSGPDIYAWDSGF
jgi:hypothetical protein